MGRRYFLIIKIIISILLLIFLASCSATNQDSYELEEQTSEKGEENVSEVDDWSLEQIKMKILDMDEIYEVKPSPDKKMVAFIKGKTNECTACMFLWEEGKRKPIKTEGVQDRICELFWSPDSKFIFMDIGTSAVRVGEIFSVEDMKVVMYGYVGNSQWSHSNWIAVGTINDIKPAVDIESDGSIDITILMSIQEKESNSKGTSDTFYLPLEWKRDGTLLYSKESFLDSGETEILEYNLE